MGGSSNVASDVNKIGLASIAKQNKIFTSFINKSIAANKEGVATARSILDESLADIEASVAPFSDSAVAALNESLDLLGLGREGASEAETAARADAALKRLEESPGVRFRAQEAQRGLERSAAAKGGLLSGGTIRGIEELRQNLASAEFENRLNQLGSIQSRATPLIQQQLGATERQAGQGAAAELSGAQFTASRLVDLGKFRTQAEARRARIQQSEQFGNRAVLIQSKNLFDF